MRILLDTHIALWAIADSAILPDYAAELIQDFNNDIYVSIASVWEVAIKNSKHPDELSMSEIEYASFCHLNGFKLINLNVNHIFTLRTLNRPESAPRHNDPFDRIMIAQARWERMKFLTHDALLPYYDYNLDSSEKFIMFI